MPGSRLNARENACIIYFIGRNKGRGSGCGDIQGKGTAAAPGQRGISAVTARKQGVRTMLVTGARVFTGTAFEENIRVRVKDGKVAAVGKRLRPAGAEKVIDLKGAYLLPGFVDVHIHAFRGRDTMEGEDAVRAMSRELAKMGVAAFCPTTMSAGAEDTRKAVEGIAKVMENPEPGGAVVLGAHMEAPFLSAARAGAQRSEFFCEPDWKLFLEMTGGRTDAVRLITVAPELAGSRSFIRKAAAAGIHVSIGHTDAYAETVHAAADWGADHVTHLFNAQRPLKHRAPGVPGAALTDDRLYCEMICDGVHLHPDIVRLTVRAKGSRRAVAITDAMEAAGMPDGTYHLGGQEVFVREGEARLGDGTLAGSVLTMKQALYNLIHVFRVQPERACAMCTQTPADSIGDGLCGRIIPGSPAPLTCWSGDWKMKKVIQ